MSFMMVTPFTATDANASARHCYGRERIRSSCPNGDPQRWFRLPERGWPWLARSCPASEAEPAAAPACAAPARPEQDGVERHALGIERRYGRADPLIEARGLRCRAKADDGWQARARGCQEPSGSHRTNDVGTADCAIHPSWVKNMPRL
jgi:hypothetical protein